MNNYALVSLTLISLGCSPTQHESVRNSGPVIQDLNRPNLLRKLECPDGLDTAAFGGGKLTRTRVEGDLKTFSVSTFVDESKNASRLPLCLDADTDTLDYVAQKSLNGIREAATFASDVFGYDLPPVTLQIHPSEQYVFDIRSNPLVLASNPALASWRGLPGGLSKIFVTDNGSWNIRRWLDRTEFVISIYPQSEDRYKNHLLPLWESDFIIKHEYGHHMFYAAFAHPIPSNQTLHSETPISEVRPSAQISVRDLVSAISEGFSDLMGIYADGEFNNIQSSDCFAVNRDVNVEHFADKHRKVFDERTVNAIFYGSPMPNEGEALIGCQTFMPQSVHHIGAIFSHIFESLLSAREYSKVEKARLAINWIRLLGERYDDSWQGPKAFFQIAIQTQLEAIFGKTSLDPSACNIVRGKVPILWSDKNFTGFETWIQNCPEGKGLE